MVPDSDNEAATADEDRIGEESSFLTTRGVRAENGGLFVSRGRGSHPRRVIASHELIFVTAGTLQMTEEQRSFDLSAGQCLLLFGGREHAGAAPYGPDTVFFWIHFVPAVGVPPDLARSVVVPQTTTVARPEVLTALFRRFLDDQESGLLTRSAADALVMLMLNDVALKGASAETVQATVLAQHARQQILTRSAEPHLSASAIANALGCHPDHIGRCFRVTYGRTLTEAIHQERLKRARAVLIDGSGTVAEVARACGFPGVAFFRRVFHRYEGMSPTAYRRLYARVTVNTE